MSLDIGFAAQTPSLPAAGAGAGGLGETFTPDLFTGTGTFGVPIDLPNGPNDIAPQLALRYDTAQGNGPFGLGWALPLPRLLRSTVRGRPRYDDTDTLVLEGSGPLVRTADGTLVPEVDTGDWRIEADGDGFLVTDRSGTRYELGTTAASRIAGAGGTTWSWLLTRIEDNLGTSAEFTWRLGDDGVQRYLAQIEYGAYRVAFGYEPRPDRLRWSRGGFALETRERCSVIGLHFTPDGGQSLVREWALGYDRAEPNGASALTSVTMTGVARDGTRESAPALTLGYSTPSRPRLMRIGSADPGLTPPGLDARSGSRAELVDWDGDGLPDLVELTPTGSARVWPNLGGIWGRPRQIGDLPQLAGNTSMAAFVDLDGNGLADAVRVDAPPIGFQPRSRDGFEAPVRWSAAPSVSLGAPQTRLVDLDGDGLPDLVWSTRTALLLAHRDETGWEERPTVVPATGEGPPTDLTDPHVHCADMTGDGTPDVVRVDGAGVTYWPYLGFGMFGAPVRMGGAPSLPSGIDPGRVLVTDLDGDGCADVLYVDDRTGTLCWWPNCAGDHFTEERRVPHLPAGAMTTLRVADLLGTGSPAVCWTAPRPSGRPQWYALDVIGPSRAGLLSSIDNGAGLVTAITYSTSAHERRRDIDAGVSWPDTLPMVLPVVSSTATTDVPSGRTDVTDYRYHDGRYDPDRREVCGFGRVEQVNVGDVDVPTLVTTRWFEMHRRPLRGRILREDHADEEGALFDRVTQDWEIEQSDKPGVVRPLLRRSIRTRFEGAPADSPASRIETEAVSFDEDGNVREQLERAFEGLSPTPASTLRTRTEYARSAAGRYRQRVCRVRQDDGNGGTLADTLTFYDHLDFGEVGVAGLVTSRFALALTDATVDAVYGAAAPDFAALGYVRRPEADGWWVELGRYEREIDATGIVRGTVRGVRGATSTLELDPTGCYPAEVTDALGLTVRATFDPRAYQPVELAMPGGATSSARFDPLARLIAFVEPGDTPDVPTRAYEYRTDTVPVSMTVERATRPGADPLHTREFLDSAGNLLERRRRDDTGEISEIRTSYGPRGLPVRHFLPERAPGPDWAAPDATTPHTALTYDALGRPTRTVSPSGAEHIVRYGPALLEETDPSGHTISRVIDAAGRVARTEEVVDGAILVSSFTFDVKGNVLEHVDAEGNVVRFAYDLLGRLLRSQRPEATHTFVLDPAGNTAEARSGSERVLRTFDAGNRLVSTRHGGVAAPVVQCTYDGAGRVSQVEDEAGTTALDYDERGRITAKTMTVTQGVGDAAGPLRLALTWRSDDQVDTITYPSPTGAPGIAARYEYDRRGLVRSVSGVVDDITYDLAGRRTATSFANGVTVTEEHDELQNALTRAVVEGPGGTLRDVAYRYDAAMNVAAIESPDPALAWTYRYDERAQLVGANPGMAGPTLEYAYDRLGNLVEAAGQGTYAYGAGGAAPTCLTSAGADDFAYDDRGHVRTAPWGTHTVDAEGRLRRIDLATGGHRELVYSHSGGLARRREVDAGGVVTRDVATPDSLVWIEDGTLVLQLTDGARVVARHDTGSGERTWLHTDHLGSLVLATDAAGAMRLRQRFDPFGRVLERSGPDAAGAGPPQGFATGEAGGADLVLLGARWYCPRIGRFLSPDPVVTNAYDELAWNSYAYARNNPVTFVDPTGRSFWKVVGAALAIVAIVALIVVLSVATLGVGVVAAAIIGMVAGGVIGGVSAWKAGGDAGDIFLGVVVGAAVGGWMAFGAAHVSLAITGALGKGVGSGALAGGLSGAMNGAAMGFASGFAGGRNNGFRDVMEKVLVGAVIGLAVGAALGALSGMKPPPGETPREGATKPFLRSEVPPANSAGGMPPATSPVDPTTSNNFGDAATEGLSIAGKAAAKGVLPHIAEAISGFTGSLLVQTIFVDALSGGGSLFYDDFQQYLRDSGKQLGLLDFLKEDL